MMQPPIFCPNFPTNMDKCKTCPHNIGNMECDLLYLHRFEVEEMLGVELLTDKNKSKFDTLF